MTITLPLDSREEARLVAAAKAKGLSAEALLREALDQILGPVPPTTGGPATGALLVAAMQSSPYKDVDLTPDRPATPVRDVVL